MPRLPKPFTIDCFRVARGNDSVLVELEVWGGVEGVSLELCCFVSLVDVVSAAGVLARRTFSLITDNERRHDFIFLF